MNNLINSQDTENIQVSELKRDKCLDLRKEK